MSGGGALSFLKCASGPVVVETAHPPQLAFHYKDQLKSKGFRWIVDKKVWCRAIVPNGSTLVDLVHTGAVKYVELNAGLASVTDGVCGIRECLEAQKALRCAGFRWTKTGWIGRATTSLSVEVARCEAARSEAKQRVEVVDADKVWDQLQAVIDSSLEPQLLKLRKSARINTWGLTETWEGRSGEAWCNYY